MGAESSDALHLLAWIACLALAGSLGFLTGRISGIASATEAISQQCREDHVFFNGPYVYACDFRGAH